MAHDGPAHRHALALAARERRRLAAEQLVEAEDARRLAHPLVDLVACGTFCSFNPNAMLSNTLMCGYSA